MLMEYVEIRNRIEEISIIDTHEHFMPLEELKISENVLGQIVRNCYLGIDCIAAGSSRKFWEPGSRVHSSQKTVTGETVRPLEWESILPSLEQVRFTSYFTSLMKGFEALYGFSPGIHLGEWRELEGLVRQGYQDLDHFDSALDTAGIQFALRDPFFSVADPKDWSNRISSVFRVDDFLGSPWFHPFGGDAAIAIAEQWGIAVHTLDDLLNAVKAGFEKYSAWGAVAIKTAAAYRRTLRFEPTSRREAEMAFTDLKNQFNDVFNQQLGNYIFREIIHLSIEYGWPVQIHTGMNYGLLHNSDPVNLVNLFQEFPEAKFVLFHGGYPYSDEAALIAKTFPNVSLDLVWMPQLSQIMASEVLSRWLDLVPVNKIMWGGDVWTVEECVGSAIQLKDVLADVLYKKTVFEKYSSDDCIDIAGLIMRQNAIDLYNLENRILRLG